MQITEKMSSDINMQTKKSDGNNIDIHDLITEYYLHVTSMHTPEKMSSDINMQTKKSVENNIDIHDIITEYNLHEIIHANHRKDVK
jgi:hypothetical protein